MLSSVYSCDVTVWKPIAGPPERISISTPVSTPPATSGPRTRTPSVSIVGSSPTIW
jgi:hypothetical protein